MIVLYFGSFNPIHRGHLALAEYARDVLRAEAVWLVLSPLNPHKAAGDQLPYDLRSRLISDALAGKPKIALSMIEQYLPAPHYTLRTVTALKMLYPKRTFALLIGEDNLEGLQRWYGWERLLSLVSLYVYPRPGYEAETQAINVPVHWCHDAPEYEISSTEIRQAVQSGRDLRHLLPNPDAWALLRVYYSDDSSSVAR